jgi:hypothetical protein
VTKSFTNVILFHPIICTRRQIGITNEKEYCNIGDDRSEISLGQGKDAAIHISSSGLQVTGQTSKPDNNRRGIIEISRSGLCVDKDKKSKDLTWCLIRENGLCMSADTLQ